MSEEEKKAIDKLKRGALDYIDSNEIEAILNLIEKQNKELEPIRELGIPVKTVVAELNRLEDLEDDREQLKQENKELKTIKGFEEENIQVSKFGEWVGKNYIDYKFEYENYQRILADSIPKSEIKKKIEELEKQIDDLMLNGDVYDDNITKYIDLKLKIQVLQELLGEEQ